MLTESQIESLIELKDPDLVRRSSGGTSVKFIRIDNYYGLKLFPDDEESPHYKCETVANYTHTVQSAYAAYGLAPKIVQRVKFGGWDGYITECITETLFDYLHGTHIAMGGVIKDYNVHTWDLSLSDRMKIYNERENIRNLAEKYNIDWDDTISLSSVPRINTKLQKFALRVQCVSEELGFNPRDCHWNNVGFGLNGELELIDFSHFKRLAR